MQRRCVTTLLLQNELTCCTWISRNAGCSKPGPSPLHAGDGAVRADYSRDADIASDPGVQQAHLHAHGHRSQRRGERQERQGPYGQEQRLRQTWGSPCIECACSSALISESRKGQPNGTGGTERGGAKEQPYSAHLRLLSGGGPLRVIAWQHHQEVHQHDLCQDQAPQEGRRYQGMCRLVVSLLFVFTLVRFPD